jgi:hypothetical protein
LRGKKSYRGVIKNSGDGDRSINRKGEEGGGGGRRKKPSPEMLQDF